MARRIPFVVEHFESVEVIDASSEGEGVVKIDGQVIFVSGGVPGDIIDIRVVSGKRNYKRGYIEKIVTPSKDRIEPKCKHFGTCGGCKWQHMTYTAQLKYKSKQVFDALTRIGGLTLPEAEPILGCISDYQFRNRLDFGMSNWSWIESDVLAEFPDKKFEPSIGFHVPKHWDKIIPIDTCYLMDDLQNQIRKSVYEFCVKNEYSFFNPKSQEGFLRSLIVRNTTLGDWMVILMVTKSDVELIHPIMKHLKNEFPQITSLNYVVNDKRNDTFYDLDIVTYAGKTNITEVFEDITYSISPKSFFQTNPEQAHQLYNLVREYANLQPTDVVYDLYTGTGSIALFIAKLAKKVVGIEYIDDAIKDAKKNAALNNIENCAFFAGDMSKILTEAFVNENGRPDIVITDPPRAGMTPDVIQMLLKIVPERIVYVSCNPATQARDLAAMKDVYEVVKYRPVDMFPQTTHVENIVLLKRI